MSATNPLPRYRQKLKGEFSPRYNGYLYFGATNLVALAAVGTAGALLDKVQPWQWLAVPIAFVAANLVEWLAHKGPMHNRKDYMEMLFERHTLLHHMYFPHDDMAVASHREWGYILFPWWAILLMFGVAFPLSALGGLLLGLNAGLLFFMVAVGYYLMYEWLHLIYHLPEHSRVGGLRIVQALKRHHMWHHHRRLMQKYNFNVTFPIGDMLFNTVYRPSAANESAQDKPDVPEDGEWTEAK